MTNKKLLLLSFVGFLIWNGLNAWGLALAEISESRAVPVFWGLIITDIVYIAGLILSYLDGAFK